ncbi:hypothetical protein [Gorillibacterium sp. sgz5001074]|uniref:hypothetical protein n=1 Tax=Gorillibacterium sp. sgz5001074 TaxID=3446695 RepID=UPI003F6806E7
MMWISLALALAIALTHLGPKIKALGKLMHQGWMLSGSGGLAVAYVFVHLLPELGEHQTVLEEKARVAWLQALEHYAYVTAMAGFILYFAVERIATAASRNPDRTESSGKEFWLHTLSFTLYNGIIGYLLVNRIQTNTVWNLLLYAFAMGLHFLVVDHALYNHHRRKYDRVGRWFLSAAVVCGWAIGKWLPIPESAFALLFAFLSGAILVNVMKEELPHQEKSNITAFVAGAAVYSALLLLSD